MIRVVTTWLIFAATTAAAQTLGFPGNATLQREVVSDATSYDLPVDIWADGTLPVRTVAGTVTQQAWRIGTAAQTTLQIIRPLREQLRNARYQIIFECQTEACGGFDFRFALQVLPPPQMQVNMGDFRFLAAERAGDDGPEFITLLVSRTAQAGHVAVTHVGPLPFGQAAPGVSIARENPTNPVNGAQPDGIAAQLDASGRAVLPDLRFGTGSAQLGDTTYPSLAAVADYLFANPALTIALVGHTDASGDLAPNIALSEQRAAAVLERLVSEYSVARQRIEAQGVGYLLPLSSNATEQGRETNRRVEVVVTSVAQ
jgi:OOP family OmpA-OmpF porin